MLRQHVVQVLPYMLSVMWPLLIIVSSLSCLGTEWLMVGVCSASNPHVLMDKSGPAEEGSVTLQGFFPARSWVFAPPRTDMPPLCAPPQECPVSARQVKAGGSEGRPGGRTQTQTEHLDMLLLFFLFLFLSVISSLPSFLFPCFSPSTPFHGSQTCLFVKRGEKRRKGLAFYVFVLFSVRFTFFLRLICHEAIRSHFPCFSSSLSSRHPCSHVLWMLW